MNNKSLKITMERLEKLNLIALDDISKIWIEDKFRSKDSDGYLYHLSSSNINSILRRNGKAAIFFNLNPFTYENINNYFRLNNIELDLITKSPTSATVPIEFRCLKHDNIFKRTWNSVKNGNIGCEICTGYRSKYEHGEICEIVKSKGCEFLSSIYKGIHNDYKLRCSCGETFNRRLDVFLHEKAYTCPKCNGITVNTIETVREDLKKHGIKIYSLKYKNQSTNIDIQYPCGFRTNRTLDNIKKSKYLCPHCNKKGYKRTTSQFYDEIYELVGNDYTFTGEYTLCDKKMKVKHNKCGYEYKISPHRFINFEQRCPVCATSKIEESIGKLLISNGTKYITEYTFDDLFGTGGGLLRFDFAIFKNDMLNCLIEYDGEYHYKPIDGEDQLKIQQNHDKRKDVYCEKNNITLYRIPYWEKENVDNIVLDILKKEEI